MKIVNFVQDSMNEAAPFDWGLTLFSYGCNLHCKMCEGYNYEKVTNKENIIGNAEEMIENKITPVHDCVIFLGGEPTIWGDSLKRALKLCHSLGLKTKIFTNGMLPQMVQEINAEGLCDAWSVDFKGISNMESMVGMKSFEYSTNIDDTIKDIQSYGLPLEVRTTFFEGNEKERKDIIEAVMSTFIVPYREKFPNLYIKYIEQEDVRGIL